MTEIFAHRGASKERPENTMAAFKRAVELNATGIELDIHLLCDGSLVVHHDAVFGRCENIEGSIYSRTKDTIQSFSIGEKFSPVYKSEVIQFFSDVLEFLQGNNLKLNVEIKAGTGFITDIADKAVAMLDEYNMADRCIISSFNHYVLAEIKKRHPKYKTGILYDTSYGYNIIEYCKTYGFDAVHPNFREIDEDFVKSCHQNGIEVNVWTVNDAKDMEKMLEYGVDDIITNDTALAKQMLILIED